MTVRVEGPQGLTVPPLCIRTYLPNTNISNCKVSSEVDRVPIVLPLSNPPISLNTCSNMLRYATNMIINHPPGKPSYTPYANTINHISMFGIPYLF